jgi:hypothetical protein
MDAFQYLRSFYNNYYYNKFLVVHSNLQKKSSVNVINNDFHFIMGYTKD